MKVYLGLGVLAFLSCACGMFEMPTKMDKMKDDTHEMNDKMDQTNSGMTQMNGKMDTTNSSIDKTNGNMSEMLKQVEKTNEGMAEMNDKMSKTNAAIHTQTLLLAKEDMLKKENIGVVYPPTATIPAAKKFAEEVYVDEMLELAHVWLRDIDQAKVDTDSLEAVGFTKEGAKEVQADLELRLLAENQNLQSIAGFLPQSTVDGIVAHVAEDGRYRAAGLSILALRAKFIAEVLLDDGVLNERLDNYGKMMTAVDYVDQLEHLAKASERTGPLSAKTRFLGDEAYVFTPAKVMKQYLEELNKRFAKDLQPSMATWQRDDAVTAARITKLEAVQVDITKRLAAWTALAH